MSLKFTLGRTVFGLSLLVGAALNYLVLDYKFGGYFSVTYPYLVCDYGLPLSEKLNFSSLWE